MLRGPQRTTRIDHPGHSPNVPPAPTMYPVSSMGCPNVATRRPTTSSPSAPKSSGPVSFELIFNSLNGIGSPIGAISSGTVLPPGRVTLVAVPSPRVVEVVSPGRVASVVPVEPSVVAPVLLVVAAVPPSPSPPPCSMPNAITPMVARTSARAMPTSHGLGCALGGRRVPDPPERDPDPPERGDGRGEAARDRGGG